jgi:hypothetical protein
LPNELVQFSALLSTELGEHIFEQDAKDKSIEMKMFLFIRRNNLQLTFPNVEIMLRIYLCFMVSNCTGKTSRTADIYSNIVLLKTFFLIPSHSGERSFSKLAQIKNSLRSNMGDSRLNMLTILSTESDILREIDINGVIDEFASKKSRRRDFH